VQRSRSIVLAILAVATGAVLALDATGVVPGPLSGALDSGDVVDTRAAPVQPAAARPVPVLAPLSSVSAPVPSAAGITAALRPLLAQPALGDRVALSVLDVESGAVLVNRTAGTGLTPASTTKLITAATALQVLGPQTRLTTRSALVPGQSTVTLVGAGDPTLLRKGRRGDAAASMTSLAAVTAESLRKQGITRIRVAYDASLFTGPQASPQWPATYVSSGVVSRVSALSVDGGKVAVDSLTRSPDPARAAAESFQKALRARSISVVGAPRQAKVAAEAVTLGQVSSPTVASLVSTMLTDSDNDIAEALGHLSGAKATGQGSFEGGSRAAVATLGDLGIPTVGVRLFDASGLSRDNLIPARVLTGVLGAAASPNQPELRGVLTGMPVGGLDGTLTERFTGPITGRAAGDVRAKTGTLTGVATLSGVVVDAEGRQLAFAVMADRVPAGGGAAAESAIDRIATRLAACGCA
jgi:serine-type D-Ala-D-Ala carboxypeptidase/endopeptidase (penicillin-binding protein 4)